MKYLIIQKARWSTGYQLEEFATAEELAAHLLNTDTLARDVIVAERLGVNISFGEYVPPVEASEAAEEPVSVEEAA